MSVLYGMVGIFKLNPLFILLGIFLHLVGLGQRFGLLPSWGKPFYIVFRIVYPSMNCSGWRDPTIIDMLSAVDVPINEVVFYI